MPFDFAGLLERCDQALVLAILGRCRRADGECGTSCGDSGCDGRLGGCLGVDGDLGGR